MNKEKLIEKLNKLWAGRIYSIVFDVLQHKVTINIETIDNEIKGNHILIFKNVSSYCFFQGLGDMRFDLKKPEKDDFLELSSINYFENCIGELKITSDNEDWVNDWVATSNFSIEIWNSLLLIEATEVTINNQTYKMNLF